MTRVPLTALGLLLAIFAAIPLHAQSSSATFDFRIGGLRAGVLTFAGSQDGSQEGGTYRVTARLESAGILGAIRRVRYDATVTGRATAKGFAPQRYTETADTGRRRSAAVMEYRAGVPQLKTYSPPRPAEARDLDPRTQGGTVDPLTALFATLRDVPRDRACTVDLALFDGKRRSAVQLAASEPAADGGITCAGEYRRVAGFSAADMAEKERFAFRLTYAPLPGGLVRVMNVTMETLYGSATLARR